MTRPDPSPLQLVLLVAALLVFGAAIGGIDPADSDFHAFYAASAAWRDGRPAPAHIVGDRLPSLNPPTFSVLVSPLTFLPYRTAFLVWSAIGILSLGASLRLVAARVRVGWPAWIWAGIVMIGTMPFLLAWTLGQVTWILLYPVTRAWSETSPAKSGAWLGVAIALKPPLALAALCLPLVLIASAASSSIALTAIAMAVTGWSPWADWMSLADVIRWLGLPTNVSLVAFATRLESGPFFAPMLAELSIASKVVVAVFAVVLFVQATRARGDRRWTLALLWSVLVSPAGWLYYLPLALGPAMASWPQGSRLAIAAIACFGVPTYALGPLVGTQAGLITAGAVYFLGMVFAWLAWSRQPARAPGTAGEISDGGRGFSPADTPATRPEAQT